MWDPLPPLRDPVIWYNRWRCWGAETAYVSHVLVFVSGAAAVWIFRIQCHHFGIRRILLLHKILGNTHDLNTRTKKQNQVKIQRQASKCAFQLEGLVKVEFSIETITLKASRMKTKSTLPNQTLVQHSITYCIIFLKSMNVHLISGKMWSPSLWDLAT